MYQNNYINRRMLFPNVTYQSDGQLPEDRDMIPVFRHTTEHTIVDTQ